jgi:ribosomal protein L15
LDEAIDVLMEKNLASKKEDGFHVNLAAIGVGKLLGGGRPLKPFIVEVSSCTDAAKRKIEEAKGRVIVLEK